MVKACVERREWERFEKRRPSPTLFRFSINRRSLAELRGGDGARCGDTLRNAASFARSTCRGPLFFAREMTKSARRKLQRVFFLDGREIL